MQSYKLRKTSETVMFPIENELRLLRQENDKSIIILMKKILSVIFSGIGTTLLCQKEYIPALIEEIMNCIFKDGISEIWMIILQILVAILLFGGLVLLDIKLISWKNAKKDNKKGGNNRKNLAEIFHKVVLNNIITGKSYTKKAEEKLEEMNGYITEYKTGKGQSQPKIWEAKRELCLYLSEATYYFMIAKMQIDSERMIETGIRKEYIEFLKEVRVLVLEEALLMYDQSVNKLIDMLEKILKKENFIWQDDKYEIFSIKSDLQQAAVVRKRISDWRTNLIDTIEKFEKKNQSKCIKG